MADDVLYHYTDATALAGIVAEEQLWCSNIVYLNDAREFDHGVDLFQRMLRAVADDKAPPLRLLTPLIARQILVAFQGFGRPQIDAAARGMTRLGPCFATSFSAKKDSLLHWMGYGKPGARYAIGFRGEQLRAFAMRQTPTMTVEDVLYGNDGLEVMRNAVADELERIGEANLPSSSDALRTMGAHICLAIGTRCKDLAFQGEQEVRLRLTGQPKKVEFRPGASCLVPFFRMTLKDVIGDLLHSILVGPSGNPRLAVASVYELLTARGLRVPVELSENPFRG
jgi:hypothetical protein